MATGPGGGAVVGEEDPQRPDVGALLARHAAFGRAHAPPGHAHALDVEALRSVGAHVVTARVDGVLVAVGALRWLDDRHAELKSMHTAASHRGRGHGTAVLHRLLALARGAGAERVSLETGSGATFAPARALYTRAGFVPCEPFGDHTAGAHSTFLTLDLRASP